MVLQRMRSRLGIVLHHELGKHVEELRSEALDRIYDSFFRVRFLNNFEMYLSMNTKKRRDTMLLSRQTNLSAREKSDLLQAKHFEALAERFKVSKESLDLTVLTYMQEQIHNFFFFFFFNSQNENSNQFIDTVGRYRTTCIQL